MSNRLNLFNIYQHIECAVLDQYDLTQVADWVCNNIKLNGRNLSFKGREYQKTILDSNAQEIVVKKCSQVGISELMLINSLAMCQIVDGFNIIYTLPTATFAQKVMKTRVDPPYSGFSGVNTKSGQDVG